MGGIQRIGGRWVSELSFSYMNRKCKQNKLHNILDQKSNVNILLIKKILLNISSIVGHKTMNLELQIKN